VTPFEPLAPSSRSPGSALARALRRARASDANFRKLVEASAEAMVILDAERSIRFANAAAETILGRRHSDLVGTRLDLPLSEGSSSERLVPRRGRRPVPVLMRTLALEGPGERRSLVTLTDLRGRKRGERIATAREIQRAFLPRHKRLVAGPVEAYALNEECQDASGDYYDLLPDERGHLGIAVGDVTGHGLGAALVMAQGRAFVRALWSTRAGIRHVMSSLNEELHRDVPRGRFMSLFLGRLDLKSGVLSWCNAGHAPALLLREATGAIERLPATSPPVGVVPRERFPAGARVRVAAGDALLLYSDGVTEAQRGRDRFGEERLAAVLADNRGANPERLLAAVRAAVTDWTGPRPLHDDLTLVALRWKPASA
jgi:PAS domain S-box-containing protein